MDPETKFDPEEFHEFLDQFVRITQLLERRKRFLLISDSDVTDYVSSKNDPHLVRVISVPEVLS